MILGLTGKNGSGKGEAAQFLKGRGFHYYSLSDVLREEAASEKTAVTRENLIRIGNRLRAEQGPGVLAERIFMRLDPEKNYVIDSIRHPAEVQALRRRKDFYLAHIHAEPEVRFERLKLRKRESDPVTFEDFCALEKKEAQGAHSSDQQLDAAIGMADLEIENNSEMGVLHDRLKEILIDLTKKQTRPGWDEYFMGIAKVAALRSNCVKRRVAAVIVKDQRIISTGYNGTPRGIKNCNEGGCPRCNSMGESGKGLDECLCSHAEENAIVQAAYHGVGIKDSVIYTTFSPCLNCTKMIINAGIREVVYNEEYPISEVPMRLLAEAQIKVRKFKVTHGISSGGR